MPGGSDIVHLKAIFSGAVVDVADNLSPGSRVRRGDPLVLLEHMKMQGWVEAPRDGLVNRVFVKVGDRVVQGQVLLEIT